MRPVEDGTPQRPAILPSYRTFRRAYADVVKAPEDRGCGVDDWTAGFLLHPIEAMAFYSCIGRRHGFDPKSLAGFVDKFTGEVWVRPARHGGQLSMEIAVIGGAVDQPLSDRVESYVRRWFRARTVEWINPGILRVSWRKRARAVRAS